MNWFTATWITPRVPDESESYPVSNKLTRVEPWREVDAGDIFKRGQISSTFQTPVSCLIPTDRFLHCSVTSAIHQKYIVGAGWRAIRPWWKFFRKLTMNRWITDDSEICSLAKTFILHGFLINYINSIYIYTYILRWSLFLKCWKWGFLPLYFVSCNIWIMMKKYFWKHATFRGVAGALFGLLSINNVIYE